MAIALALWPLFIRAFKVEFDRLAFYRASPLCDESDGLRHVRLLIYLKVFLAASSCRKLRLHEIAFCVGNVF